MKESILILTSEFPPLPGGIGNHAHLLSKYLEINNFNVSVLCDFRNQKEDFLFDSQQKSQIYRIPRNKSTYMNRIKKAFTLAKQNDVILCSGKFSLWLGGLLKLLFPRKKNMAVLHGSELKAGGTLSQKMTKWSLTKFDHLIAVSEFTKQFALTIDAALKIEVINNGIELGNESIRLQKKTQQHSLYLITVGNLTFRKGQQNLIKALPLLKKHFPDIHYHCVGIPTEHQKFSQLAKELNVIENITFHGVLSDTDRNKILQQSSVFVMLSQIVKNDFEGFGIALLEANALGIPVIGSRNSGIADAIKDGYSGFLVDQENPIEIEKALTEILNNYEQYSTNAMAWSKEFDWNQIIKKYIKAIHNEA